MKWVENQFSVDGSAWNYGGNYLISREKNGEWGLCIRRWFNPISKKIQGSGLTMVKRFETFEAAAAYAVEYENGKPYQKTKKGNR
jgi:hypothetical protein